MCNLLILLFVSYVGVIVCLDVGDSCTHGMSTGVCKNIFKCSGAVEAIRKNPSTLPTICGYQSNIPVICCVEESRPEEATDIDARWASQPMTQKRPQTTTTEYTPTEETFIDLEAPKTCLPLRNFTVAQTDRKAWKKCLQYQEELVFPCEESKSLLGGKVRVSHCKHNVAKLIVGGVDAAKAEFPHMVMLSHSTDINSLSFGCGGSLLSDWFILTAGHCTYLRNVGPVKYAVLGVLNITETNLTRVYGIDKVIQHPQYNPMYHYHDIALLKTDRRMHLDMYAVPACLDTGRDYDKLDDSEALATGWGALWYDGKNAEILQKVVLKKFKDEECIGKFQLDRRLPQGYNPEIQMCFGDNDQPRDACTGDSGGPLQLKMSRVKCMYSIIGVTSTGRKCGKVGLPGIYTRVAPYVSWIEGIVWPNDL